MSERLNLGLDFGTSNSSVGTQIGDEIRIISVEEESKSQPSSLFVRIDGYISVGSQAILDFLGDREKEDKFHFIPSIKPGLHQESYKGIVLTSKKRDADNNPIRRFFSVNELASALILDLKEKAESELGLNFEHVVMGRPVYFSNEPQRDSLAQERLKDAAHSAGFKEVEFLFEPVGAAIYYERVRAKPGEKLAFIFDFGGGTLDTCILQIDSNRQKVNSTDELNSSVMASHGIKLGGMDLDKDVFKKFFQDYFGSRVTFGKKDLRLPHHIFDNITDWHLLNFRDKDKLLDFLKDVAIQTSSDESDSIKRLITLIAEQQIFALLKSIETAKIKLSDEDKANIVHKFQNIIVDTQISREEYEAAVCSRESEIKECVEETLKQAEAVPKDIDVVISVGGSSRNQFVESFLSKTFGKIVKPDAFTSVVAGLSIAAKDIYNE